MTRHRADVVIIGGGIAGLSAGWALADTLSVILVEQETTVASHSSGRSAAVISETYGETEVCALATASKAFLINPPDSFTEVQLLSPRGMLWVSDEQDSLDEAAKRGLQLGARVKRLTPREAQCLVPVFRNGWLKDALFEPDAMSIDVAALVDGFRSGLTKNGGTIRTSSEAIDIQRSAGNWEVTTSDHTIQCDVVINAAGAWADGVAERAGVQPLGLQPMRRTVFLFPPFSDNADMWPLVMDAGGRFYFEPEGDFLLASPAEETPTHAHDARADDLEMAKATEILATASTLVVKGVRRRWAGLRTFSSDRLPVVGFDPDAPGFFWLAGQGGAGIKTSPAMAALTRALVLDEQLPTELDAAGIAAETLSPGRLRSPQMLQ